MPGLLDTQVLSVRANRDPWTGSSEIRTGTDHQLVVVILGALVTFHSTYPADDVHDTVVETAVGLVLTGIE